MANLSIEIKGAKELIARFNKLDVLEVVRPAMQRSVLRLQGAMQVYPPAPAHSRYVRTGTLGRRWTTNVNRSGGKLTGKVGNNTEYGPFVQSKRFQRRFHQRTGWVTDDKALRDNQTAIVADFERTIQRALE